MGTIKKQLINNIQHNHHLINMQIDVRTLKYNNTIPEHLNILIDGRILK